MEMGEKSFSFFCNVYAKQAEKLVTLDQIRELITNGALRRNTFEIRRLRKEGRTDEADRLKRSLPAITVCARFDGERKSDKATAYTGLCFVDIDHAKQSPAVLIDRCRQLPYVLFAHVSVSGEGVHLVVSCDNDSPDNHAFYLQSVCDAVSRALGEETDRACKDISRLMLLSYDPEAYFNAAVQPYRVCLPASDEPSCPSAASGGAGLSRPFTVGSYLDAIHDLDWTKGNRHATMLRLAVSLNRKGFGSGEAAAECVRRYSQPGFEEPEIRQAVNYVYKTDASQHAVNRQKGASTLSPSVTFFGGCSKSVKVVVKEAEDIDIHDSYGLLGSFPDDVYNHLPRTLLELMPNDCRKEDKDLDLLSILTLLSSAMPGVSGRLNGMIYFTPVFCSIVGESASGKGRVASMVHILDGWREYKEKQYAKELEVYQAQLEAYVDYCRLPRSKRTGAAPEKPKEIRRKFLRFYGYTSASKMIEQLSLHEDIASFMFETELDTLNEVMQQDFGSYEDLFNKAYHHESLGSHTHLHGNMCANRPQLSVFVSGTPRMFKTFIPSTENGTFSRFLIYRLVSNGEYMPLTDNDDRNERDQRIAAASEAICRYARFLEQSATFVSFTDMQRQRINRFFEREVHQNWIFGNEDRNSVVLRYRISLFRICMILTALRKAEAGWMVRNMTVADEDFETAFGIIKTCLRHAYMVGTSLEHRKKEVTYTFPYVQLNLFADMPKCFTRAQMIVFAESLNVSESSVDRLLKKSVRKGLTVSDRNGHYEKTLKGEEITRFGTRPEEGDRR